MYSIKRGRQVWLGGGCWYKFVNFAVFLSIQEKGKGKGRFGGFRGFYLFIWLLLILYLQVYLWFLKWTLLSFCLFLHLLHLYLTALDAASLRGRRGRYARTPSGSCARFYYITRGFLMSGAKKLGKSDYFVTYGLSLRPWRPWRPWRLVSHFNISI